MRFGLLRHRSVEPATLSHDFTDAQHLVVDALGAGSQVACAHWCGRRGELRKMRPHGRQLVAKRGRDVLLRDRAAVTAFTIPLLQSAPDIFVFAGGIRGEDREIDLDVPARFVSNEWFAATITNRPPNER